MKAFFILILSALLSIASRCFDSYPSGDPSMGAPYRNEADIGVINEAFSSSASAPWGFAHNGIDFPPGTNTARVDFVAVFDGKVDKVELAQNDRTGNWQVSVQLRYNGDYCVTYGFEPMTNDQGAGNARLSNISVSAGIDFFNTGSEVCRTPPREHQC